MDVAESKEAYWLPLWEFLIHVLLGTGIFVLLAVPAVGLNLLISWLGTLKVGYWIILGLEIAEYSLFIVDIFLYLMFLWKTTWQIVQKL